MYQREMVLYTRGPSLCCWRARRFLKSAGYGFEVVDVAGDPELLERLSEAAHRKTAPPHAVVSRKMAPPQEFVDRRPVGDMDTVRALVGSGQFERLLRDWLQAVASPAARRSNGAASGGGASAPGTPRSRPGPRPWAALMPLLARLETVGPRRGPCEAHYGTRSNVPCGRYWPRYGPGQWLQPPHPPL